MNNLNDTERWLLSYYRDGELSGALFFGKMARYLPAGPIQKDLTRHFADESEHASLWTDTLYQLGYKPVKINDVYQDAYLDAAGLPINIMEILAITTVFEDRVLSQYQKHYALPGLNPQIAKTLKAIMDDEKWHILWIKKALQNLEAVYGKNEIQKKLDYYKDADNQVYQKTKKENDQRFNFLFETNNTRDAA